MPNGDPLPGEIVLTLAEVRVVLFALDAGVEATPPDTSAHEALSEAVGLLVHKLLPDLRDL